MDEFEVHLVHPGWAAAWRIGQSAVEVEGGTYGYDYAFFEVWQESVHEDFLLWRAKGNPNDIGAVFLNYIGNAFVIELINCAEGKFLECHTLDVGVLFCKVVLQGIEHVLLCAKKYHAVLACSYGVDEDVATTVLLALVAVYLLYENGNPTAVTN